MNGIPHRVFDHALHVADALGDPVGEAVPGFAAAAPMIVDLDGAAAPSRAGRRISL